MQTRWCSLWVFAKLSLWSSWQLLSDNKFNLIKRSLIWPKQKQVARFCGITQFCSHHYVSSQLSFIQLLTVVIYPAAQSCNLSSCSQLSVVQLLTVIICPAAHSCHLSSCSRLSFIQLLTAVIYPAAHSCSCCCWLLLVFSDFWAWISPSLFLLRLAPTSWKFKLYILGCILLDLLEHYVWNQKKVFQTILFFNRSGPS